MATSSSSSSSSSGSSATTGSAAATATSTKKADKGRPSMAKSCGLFPVSVHVTHPLTKDDKVMMTVAALSVLPLGNHGIHQVYSVNKTTLVLGMKTRAAADTLINAGITYNGQQLKVHDGETARPPPGVRLRLFGLPLGFTIDSVKQAVSEQIGRVRHVAPDYLPDPDGKPTTILTDACAVWVDPDAKQLRRVLVDGCEVKVVDPRMPQRKRRRHRRRNNSKKKADDQPEKSASDDKAAMDVDAAAPAAAVPRPATSSASASSSPSSASSSAAPSNAPASASRALALSSFVVGPAAVARAEEEWHRVESRRRGRSSSPPQDDRTTIDTAAPMSSAVAALMAKASPKKRAIEAPPSTAQISK